MSDTAILVSDLHKKYDLGTINSGTLVDDLKKGWAKLRGKDDPTLTIGTNNSLKQYWALQGVDFEIKKGDSVGIIGKNGAGKSTLLKILSRVTVPTKGRVKINGRIASLLEVGTGFHPDLTGKENIFMNGAILGMSNHEIRTKLDEIIAFSGVEKYIDTPVKRYSSGMYVRLAFAVAAHLEPEILIIDEVLAVGDLEFQKKCLGKMGEVSKEGRTVIFVSHNMSSVLSLCSHAIYLQQGKMVSQGVADQVTDLYMKDLREVQYLPDLNSEIFFDKIILSDINGQIKNEFCLGDDIALQYELIMKDFPSTIELSIDIHDQLGDLFAHVSNYDDNFIVDSSLNINGKISIGIKLKNLSLVPANTTFLYGLETHMEELIFMQKDVLFSFFIKVIVL